MILTIEIRIIGVGSGSVCALFLLVNGGAGVNELLGHAILPVLRRQVVRRVGVKVGKVNVASRLAEQSEGKKLGAVGPPQGR